MFIKQCKDTFIRHFGDIGYITSQLTKRDRVYDPAGQAFLSVISRTPCSIDSMARDLSAMFVDASASELEGDLIEFMHDLETAGFVVIGDTLEATEDKDIGFSYDVEEPKTVAIRLLSQDADPIAPRSDDVMMNYFRKHPTIFGIHVEVTSRCNERCLHCYQPRAVSRDMEMSLFRDLLGQLRKMGTASMTLSGGEPTLHPDFPQILRLTRESDMIINVLSNGLLIDDEMTAVLKDVNLNMIQISLYSTNPRIHDEITRVGGSHERTVAAVERLIAANVPVQISCPIMKLNRDAYCDVSRWCSERKIRVLSDFVMMAKTDFDISNLAQRLDIDETRQVIEDILDADKKYHLQLETEPKTSDLEHYAKQPVCGVCIDSACITEQGILYPCSGFQGYPLGNIMERSLRDIWEKSEPVRFLRSVRNDSFPGCLTCEARDYCIMCLVRNFNESGGDMFKVADHFCQVAFLNKELVDQWRLRRSVDHGGQHSKQSG